MTKLFTVLLLFLFSLVSPSLAIAQVKPPQPEARSNIVCTAIGTFIGASFCTTFLGGSFGGGGWPTKRGYVFYDSFVKTHTNLLAIDILGVDSTDEVFATHSGRVIYAGWEDYGVGVGGYGNVVLIQSDALGIITLYGHLSSFKVKVGDNVEGGTVIGNVGATSSNSDFANLHLHYEHRAIGGRYGLLGQGPKLGPPFLPKDIPLRCSTKAECDAEWKSE